MPQNFGLTPNASVPAPATAPEPVVVQTSKSDLPPLAPDADVTLRWDGVEGLKIEQSEMAAVVPGLRPLGLRAVPTEGLHRLGISLSGLPAGGVYRVTAWVRAGSLGEALLDVRDGKKANQGSAVFNLAARPSISKATGDLTSVAVATGADQWTKASVELRSFDGVIVLYVGQVLPDGSTAFRGDAQMHLMFGGVEVHQIADANATR
jgi:hypothetical protein